MARRGLARVVRVDDVASGAAGRAVVARLIVGAEKVECRIEKARLLQSEINRIRAVVRAEAARAQAFVGLAGIFFLVGIADLETPFAATLKDAKNVARLRNFPAGQRVELWQPSLECLLLRASAAGWLNSSCGVPSSL